MKIRIVEDELRVHLNMQETEELEATGYVIAVDEEDSGFYVCVTYVNDLEKTYDVWTKANAYKYSSWGLRLSYNQKQEEEEI